MALIKAIRTLADIEVNLGGRRHASNHFDSITDKCQLHLLLGEGVIVMADLAGKPIKAMPISSVRYWDPFPSDDEAAKASDMTFGRQLPKKVRDDIAAQLAEFLPKPAKPEPKPTDS